MNQKFAVITPIAMAVALLAGCGGGSSTPETKQPVAAFVGVTLTGTVATGAAMADANVAQEFHQLTC